MLAVNASDCLGSVVQGAAIAERYAHENAKLVLVARTKSELEQVRVKARSFSHHGSESPRITCRY